ncbi:MAG: lasso peptide biosynthesis B2 protein [Gemmatimonadales bacterium]|nr:lasso peptide biosynthesis B2 protein [Gemmatimonadales bacterium]
MGRVRGYIARSSTERGLFTRAVLLVAAVRVGLVLLPFRAVVRILACLARSRAPGAADESLRDQIVWAVERANRFVPGRGTCLHEALAGQVILVRRGFRARLQIGVKKDDAGNLAAHAWVEVDGAVVIGGSAAGVHEYAPLRNVDSLALGGTRTRGASTPD